MFKDDRPDSLKKIIISVIQFGLMLIGLIGIAIEFFRDNGLLQQIISKMANSPIGLFSFPLLFVVLFLINKWMSGKTDGKASERGNLPMYLMMGIGAYFVFNIVTTGSF
ncbi:MAG: hypothetical protein ACAH07_10420 [Methylophilaceae bacterium]|nr:hypothetical protein [Methyloradius sp.]